VCVRTAPHCAPIVPPLSFCPSHPIRRAATAMSAQATHLSRSAPTCQKHEHSHSHPPASFCMAICCGRRRGRRGRERTLSVLGGFGRLLWAYVRVRYRGCWLLCVCEMHQPPTTTSTLPPTHLACTQTSAASSPLPGGVTQLQMYRFGVRVRVRGRECLCCCRGGSLWVCVRMCVCVCAAAEEAHCERACVWAAVCLCCCACRGGSLWACVSMLLCAIMAVGYSVCVGCTSPQPQHLPSLLRTSLAHRQLQPPLLYQAVSRNCRCTGLVCGCAYVGVCVCACVCVSGPGPVLLCACGCACVRACMTRTEAHALTGVCACV